MMTFPIAFVGGVVGFAAGAWLLVWGAGDGGTLNLWWLILAEVFVAMGTGVSGGFAMEYAGEDLKGAPGTRIGIAIVGGVLTVMVAYFAHVNAATLEAAAALEAAEAAGAASGWLDHLSLGALPELHLRGRWNMDFSIGWTAIAAALLGTIGTYKMIDVAGDD